MSETTFTSFTPAQARAYATVRGSSYPPVLYEKILQFHFASAQGASNPSTAAASADHGDDDRHNEGLTSTPQYGQRLQTLLDVGSGPGKVVYDLLPFFDRVVGIDPGQEMIAAAKADARFAEVADRVQFLVAGAEQCGDIAALEGQVDVITVAMAAHWFDMPAFYASAAKALKPGGVLAMWTCSSLYAHPSNPAHKELQAILSRLEDEELGQYAVPGNKISQGAYRDLPLPWDLELSKDAWVTKSFTRHDWDLDGVPSAADMSDGTPGPYLDAEDYTPHELGAGLKASSMTVRWREANRENLESGEIKDCVTVAMGELDKVLAAAGKQSFRASPSTTLLLLQRAR